MRQRLISMKFFEVYYFANIVHNVLTDPFSYIRNIHDWYEDRESEIILPSFPKWSRLHDFVGYIVKSVIDENICDTTIDAVVHKKDFDVWVDQALRHYNFRCIGFRKWLEEEAVPIDNITEDNLADYHLELYLSGDLEELIAHISEEVFFILFGNRILLSNLNWLLANVLVDTCLEEIPCNETRRFTKSGRLKRVSIPKWVKRAVFYRDRGLCTGCNKDISGILTTQPDRHYDHIVPLSIGGLNDVTNIQLLCQMCNLKKSSKPIPTSSLYESWY